MRRFVLFLACAAAAATARAETLEEAFRRQLEAGGRQQFLTLTAENDMFASGTDRHYTNGVRLSWFDTGFAPPSFARDFNEAVPLFSGDPATAVHYSLGHNLYTPENISLNPPSPRDRPYAAFLYGSMGLSVLDGNELDTIELTLGVIGPAALGEPIQKSVHDFVGSDDPKGWGAQLKNEPGLMVSWQRLWPEALVSGFDGLHFRAMPYAGATLGNVHTYGNGGVIFQLVPNRHKWQGLPLRVRPAMPGSGYFSVPDGAFSWSVFAGFEGRAVGRNVFLDGNTFRSGPSVDKKYLVGDASGGVSFAYGRTQLSYTLNWRSEEFYGQKQPDIFGAVSLGRRF